MDESSATGSGGGGALGGVGGMLETGGAAGAMQGTLETGGRAGAGQGGVNPDQTAVTGGSGNAGGLGGALPMGGGAGMEASGGSGAEDRHQFNIRFDYRFDTAGFFDVPERRAALEAAGAAWSRVLRDDFNPVPAGTAIRLRNPENRTEYVWVENMEEDIDDLILFVGSTDAIPGLGRGGPAGLAISTDPEVQEDFVVRSRGSDFEPWAGSISFNPTSDFFFDTTPETDDDIPPAQFDFMSNAIHEIGHVLGFSTGSVAFQSLVDGQTFVGPVAQEIHGGPVPLAEGLNHFPQEMKIDGLRPVMGISQLNGIRSVPGPLELAMLADCGYEIAEDPM